MGAAVAAAGSLLGGLAAKAIMGTPTTYGPDTSIPGVASATIKEGGKGMPDEKVPQVDISKSLQWFQEAADIQTKYYNEGLNYYRDSLKAAAFEINQGYQKANETLQPLSYSSNQALNEQMRMMGLDPISSTVNAYKHAGDVGLDANIQKMISDAENIRDPNERAQAKSAIMNSINNNVSMLQSMADQQGINASGLAGPRIITGKAYNPADYPDSPGVIDITGVTHNGEVKVTDEEKAIMKAAGFGGDYSNWYTPEQVAAYNAKAKSTYDQHKAEILAQQDTLMAKLKNIQQFGMEYDTSYTDEYDRGYTGEEVAAKVAATPGYQFQLDQGTKAIERQGAAAGMLGSGNTLTALTNYGQGLAQNFYGVYMDNLAKIVNEGSSATHQIAQNQVNQGKDYGALIEAGGNAMMQTAQLVGNAQAESKYRAGQLYADAAQFNASMQYSGIQAGLKRQTDVQLAAMNNQANNQMANIAQQRFNYGVFQNQQGGAAYAANV